MMNGSVGGVKNPAPASLVQEYIPGGAGSSSMNAFTLVIISVGRIQVNSINLYLMTFDPMAHTLRECRFGATGLAELRK